MRRFVTRNRDLAVGKPCCYCKRPLLSTSYANDPDPAIRGQMCSEEHIRPKSKNGTDEYSNITWACQRCNSMRGNLDYDIFRMFAQVILTAYPDAPFAYLKSCLQQFITSLAEIAIRNKQESRRAISLALLRLGDDLNGNSSVKKNKRKQNGRDS